MRDRTLRRRRRKKRHHASEKEKNWFQNRIPHLNWRPEGRKEEVKKSTRASGREEGERRTNFLSNLLHKSRDIGKRVSRFLCNEFAVRREGKEGSKSRPGCEARLVNISFYKWSFRRDRLAQCSFAAALTVAKLYSRVAAREVRRGGTSASNWEDRCRGGINSSNSFSSKENTLK